MSDQFYPAAEMLSIQLNAERNLTDDLYDQLAETAHSLENFQDVPAEVVRVLARYREARG